MARQWETFVELGRVPRCGGHLHLIEVVRERALDALEPTRIASQKSQVHSGALAGEVGLEFGKVDVTLVLQDPVDVERAAVERSSGMTFRIRAADAGCFMLLLVVR